MHTTVRSTWWCSTASLEIELDGGRREILRPTAVVQNGTRLAQQGDPAARLAVFIVGAHHGSSRSRKRGRRDARLATGGRASGAKNAGTRPLLRTRCRSESGGMPGEV
jgi:hypothetical protein